jgi:two-component system heavy metal sensor histidine kinase CusS
VRRGLQPLQALARQTQAIAPDRLSDRLHLAHPVEELQPWIDQFNGLMDRLQRAYVQLEGFNADVAHELRTPLANVMGQTEVALSRERSPEALRETLVSNLEEMQRLAALVNDMLFLSQSDRGAVARGGPRRVGATGRGLP